MESSDKPTTLQELFSDESKWCKEALAKTTGGSGTSPYNENSVAYCLVGGLSHLGQLTPENVEKLNVAIAELYPHIRKRRFHPLVLTFNNDPETKFEQVRKVIEHANL